MHLERIPGVSETYKFEKRVYLPRRSLPTGYLVTPAADLPTLRPLLSTKFVE